MLAIPPTALTARRASVSFGHAQTGRAVLPAATTDRKPLFGEAIQKSGLSSLLRRVILLGAMLFPVGGGLVGSQKALANPGNREAHVYLPNQMERRDKKEPALEILEPGPLSENIEWGPNVRVLAACGERFKAVGKDDIGGCYTNNLLKILKESGIKGVENAHDFLETTGYQANYIDIDTEEHHNTYYYPISTSRKKELWLKNAYCTEPKERYAILAKEFQPVLPTMDQERAMYGNQSFHQDLDTMEQLLQDPKFYNLPADQHIQRLDNVTRTNLKKAIENLAETFRNNPDAELLIYYSGHGIREIPKTIGRGEYREHKEGDGIGMMQGAAISETMVKAWLKKFLPPKARVLIIIDACHSGAWIAKNGQGNAVKALS